MRRCGAVRFSCPYHAWSYDLDGKLRAIPEEAGFATLDRERHGLLSFPVEEKFGLVWVTPREGGYIDVAERSWRSLPTTSRHMTSTTLCLPISAWCGAR